MKFQVRAPQKQLAVYFHQFDTSATRSRYKILEQNERSIKGNIESGLTNFLKDIRVILRADGYVENSLNCMHVNFHLQ